MCVHLGWTQSSSTHTHIIIRANVGQTPYSRTHCRINYNRFSWSFNCNRHPSPPPPLLKHMAIKCVFVLQFCLFYDCEKRFRQAETSKPASMIKEHHNKLQIVVFSSCECFNSSKLIAHKSNPCARWSTVVG